MRNSCKFQHFSKRISGMKGMQVYNQASVKIIICRLERVRQRQEYSTEEQPRMYAGGEAALFEDYAVLDRPNRCFMLGNLVRLVFSSNHGPVEYRPPVSYEDPQKITSRRSFSCMTEEISSMSSCVGIYELKSSEAKSFSFTDLSTHVNLTVTEDYRLEIAYEELSVTKSDVAKLLQPAPRQHNRERSSELELD